MGDADLIFARELGELAQRLLDLAREYVYALYLHHVVSSAHDRVDPRELAPAFALARDYPRQVVSAVSDQRRALFYERGYNYLAQLAVGQVLPGYRIDYFYVYIVVPVVHAAVVLTGDSDTGSVYLGEPVYVVELYAKLGRDAFAHFIAPAFGADNALFKTYLIRYPAFGYLLGQQERVRRGGA